MKTPNINSTRRGSSWQPAIVGVASKMVMATACSLFALASLTEAQTLQHRYSFVTTANDSVGTANGTVVTPNGGTAVTIANGLVLPGGGGPGFSGYVTLPAGILNTTTNLTVECWVTQSSQDGWAELYSFNNGTPTYFAYIPFPANNNNDMVLAFRTNNNESDASSGTLFPTAVEEHVTATFNSTNLQGLLYFNANQVASVTEPNASYTPGALNTANNYLGQDPWPDPQFQGTLYEFRIYNGALSPLMVAADDVAGPTNLVTSIIPLSDTLVVNNTNLVLTGTVQGSVLITLPTTGPNIVVGDTGDATNWVSSNISVLKVNSSGLIEGVGLGSATVSATVRGVTATSPTIYVTAPQTLLHRYSFATDATDSVGGANGTLVPAGNVNGTNASASGGLILPGGGGGGYSGYLQLPSGILTNTTSLTVECWVTQNQGNTWAELWDFANNNNQNFGLIPDPANNATHTEVAFTPHGNEVDLQSSISFPNNSEQYVVVTYNNFNLSANLYTNAALIATQTFPDTSYAPSTYGGGTTVNVLGNDIYNDSQFQGTVYEFRIWNGAVSPAYIEASAAAGPGVVITNEIPQSLSISLSSTSMLGAGTQQATVLGNLLQISGVNFTGAATNWVTSNPNVLTVNSSGLITAINGGSATVSATVDGVTATSASITVATTPPVLPQKPVNVTAAVNDNVNFSVGALGGNLAYQWKFNSTPISGATNATLVLTNIALTQAGTYSITVTNLLGTTNASAMLTVVQAILEHRYSFASDASDSVGGANGTIVPPGNVNGGQAFIGSGLYLPGNTAGGFGYSGYVSLPSGLLTNTTSLTIETWVTQNSGNEWATIWDFADNGNINFELCPNPASGRNNGNMVTAFTPNGNEQDLDTPVTFPNGTEQYVVLTVNAGSLLSSLYTNAILTGTLALPNTSYLPSAIGGAGGTAQDMLGNDTYGDFQFSGTIYEFRIWDGAVTPFYQAVSAAAGPGIVVTNVIPISVTVSVANSSMVEGQSQPATALANFQQVSGVPMNTVATNWVSSNLGVLTVDTNGNVTAVGTGSATISATVAGVPGTSSLISVPTSPPIITVNPAASETLLSGVTFNTGVTNIGTPPFTYFWYTNSSTVPFITSSVPTLAIPNVQVAATASYTCVVSNQYGTAQSSSLALTVVAASPYQQAVEAYGALAYWPLNETSGSTAYDEIGGNNGTYNGNLSLGNAGPTNAVFGASSLAAGFDGATAYVDIPEGPFNILGAITVVTWVQLGADNGFDGVFGHGDQSWRLTVNGSGNPGANDGSVPGDANSPNSINDGNWHMVAYVYNGTPGQANNGALYVDGALVGNNNVTVAPAGDNLDVWIGGAPDYGLGSNRRMMYGDVADAAIFTQAFNAAQVQGLFTGTFVAGPTSLSISNSVAGIVLTWPSGTLLQSSGLTGPWITNSAATSPYTVPATNNSEFFKLLLP